MYGFPCIEQSGVTDNFCVLEWGPQMGEELESCVKEKVGERKKERR